MRGYAAVSPRRPKGGPALALLRRTPRALCFLVLLPAAVAAREPRGVPLDPSKALSQYVHQAWTTTEGLPQNSVRTVVQTRDGYLWLGTQEGLVRFDGVRFTVFDKKNTPGVLHNFVWTMLEDREGSLWIGTVGGGLTRYRDGHFTAFTTREGLVNDYVRALHEDADGSLWVGTDGGVSRLRNGESIPVPEPETLGTERVRALHRDRRGVLWVGTDGAGLGRLAEGRYSRLTLKDGLRDLRIAALAEAADGALFIATQSGLFRMIDGSIVPVEVPRLPRPIVAALHIDTRGSLFVGTYGSGLACLRDGRWSVLSTSTGLSNDFVAALVHDREGSLWIGTDGGGLNRLRDAAFATVGTREGLSGNAVSGIHEDREGALWLGTVGAGLNRLKDGAVKTLRTGDGLSSDVVFSVLQDRAGAVWIGTDGGLDRLRDERITRYSTRDGLSSNRVRGLAEDRKGTLWIATDGGGLNRLQDGRFSALTTRDGLGSNVVTSVFEDSRGVLWIGSEGGLHRLEDGKLQRFTTRDGLSNDFVFGVHEDRAGTLWIGTFGGLNRLRDGRFAAITTAQGLSDDLVARILEDDTGHLWMSSNKGVSRIRISDAEAVADGRSRSLPSLAFGVRDGMRSSECNGGFSPAGTRTRDGRLWFPTVEGAAVVDPARIPRNAVPPPVLVESFVVDNAEVAPAAAELSPGKQTFEFHYTALALRDPAHVRFRYRLLGQDRDWVDAGARRVAYYTNLPPGRHEFQVVATNEDGVASEAGARVLFSLAPQFHETRLFVALCVAGAAGLLFGAYRMRVKHLVLREQALVAQVEERTEDLRAAQDRISRLLASSPAASETIPAWSQALAEEVAAAVGVERIGLFEVDKETLTPLTASSMRVPSLDDLRRLLPKDGKSFVDWDEGTLVPMISTSGEICGALAVSRRTRPWGDTERRLLVGLAHQLAGAFELSRMRRQLAVAEARQSATRREMHDRGIATLLVCPSCGRCYDHTVSACEKDGVALEAPPLLPFRLLDRYRFVRVLGQGGMGLVIAAHDEKLARDVAIKLIRPEYFGRADLKERFEREARTVARIQHPGVIELHDSGELPDGTSFLVIELLRGADLSLVLSAHGPGSPAGGRARAARLLGARGGAPRGRRASGHQARERLPARRAGRVPGQGPRLRVGQVLDPRGGAHPVRNARGHAALHVPRAGERAGAGRAHRPVLVRRRLLRGAAGPEGCGRRRSCPDPRERAAHRATSGLCGALSRRAGDRRPVRGRPGQGPHPARAGPGDLGTHACGSADAPSKGP